MYSPVYGLHSLSNANANLVAPLKPPRKPGTKPLPPPPSVVKAAYRTLGLKPGASSKDVRKAIKNCVKKYHPDRKGDTPANRRKISELANARDVLLAVISRGRPRKHVLIDKGAVIVNEHGEVHKQFKTRKEAEKYLNDLPPSAPIEGTLARINVLGSAAVKQEFLDSLPTLVTRGMKYHVVGTGAAERMRKMRRKNVTQVIRVNYKGKIHTYRFKAAPVYIGEGETLVRNPFNLDRGSYFMGKGVPHGAARIAVGGNDGTKISEIVAARRKALGLVKEIGAPPVRPQGNSPDAFDNPKQDPLNEPLSKSEWDNLSEREFQGGSPVIGTDCDPLLYPSAEDRELPMLKGWGHVPIDGDVLLDNNDNDQVCPEMLQAPLEAPTGCGSEDEKDTGLSSKTYKELSDEATTRPELPPKPSQPALPKPNQPALPQPKPLRKIASSPIRKILN
jgi:hypothetical protein